MPSFGQLQEDLDATSVVNTATIDPNSDCEGVFDNNMIFQRAIGSISSGETQTCHIINTVNVNGGTVPVPGG